MYLSLLLFVCCTLVAFVIAGVVYQEAAGATTIEGVNIKWEVSDSKGNPYLWSMPVVTYEDQIVESRSHVRDKINLDLDGETVRVVSLDNFVKKSFVNVIDAVYDNSVSNSDFIWEVWHIVSQLTVYDKDIHEHSEGRYALETLSRGGGDCEDLTILIADMLMSSQHTDNWTIQYVFIDSNNPIDPQKVNHVILYVNDGNYQHYIEATAPPSWDHYPEGVSGWWVDVVPYTDDLNFSGQDMRWMDLQHRDFSYADLSGADLEGAHLAFSDLRYADLSGADLGEANLYGAYLEGADLYGATLSNATLIGVYMGEANLYQANLYGADMRRVGAYGADLSEAYLYQADLGGASLYGANLSQVYMYEANLYGANLGNTDLSGAILYQANLGGANLDYADLRDANLGGAQMSGSSLIYADLRDANLGGAQMYGANLLAANLDGANLDGAVMLGVIGR